MISEKAYYWCLHVDGVEGGGVWLMLVMISGEFQCSFNSLFEPALPVSAVHPFHYHPTNQSVFPLFFSLTPCLSLSFL